MRAYARVLLAGAVGAALGLLAVSVVGPGRAAADDEEKAAKEAVEKLVATVAKGDKDAAKKQAEEVAKKVELSTVMEVFKLRDKKGRGAGKNPVPANVDGIEAQVMALAKKEPTKGALEKSATDLEEMANVLQAISLLAEVYTPKKPPAGKNLGIWKDSVKEMQGASGDLAKAAKGKDAAAIKTAATKLYSACTNCHGEFRD